MTLPGTSAGDERLTVGSRGRARLVPDTSISVDPATGDMHRCRTSVRVARQDDGTLAATWWSVRDDSSAMLLAAVSPDGGATWGGPLRVDTTDVSVTGCNRPSPALAASAGFVHITYARRGTEGAGIFYAHSMTRGSAFEQPVAIIYGDHLTATAVDADRGVVAVAYEDPNGAATQVGLAVSHDWGHIFGDRVRGSTGVGAASTPQVAVAGREIAVSWLQGSTGGEAASRPSRIVRVGRIP